MADKVDLDALIAKEREKIGQGMERSVMGDLQRQAGLTARSLGPIMAGGALGAAAGAPVMGVGAVPGFVAGATSAALAGPLSDLAVSGYRSLKNMVSPSNAQPGPLPSQALEQLMTYAGLPQPQTPTERVVQGAIRSGAEALAGAGGAGLLGRTLTPRTVGQGVAQTLAEAPVAQTAAGTLGSGAAQTAREMGAPEAVALPIGIAAGTVPFVARPQNLFAAPGEVRQGNINILQQQNIPLSPAQQLEGAPPQVIESVMKYLPTSAPAVARQEDMTQRAFTGSILRRAGIDSDIATPEVLTDARRNFQREYNALERQTNIRGDEQLFNDLGRIESNYVVGFPDTIKPVWNARRDEVLRFATGERTGEGRTYHRLQSELSEEIAKASRSTDPSSGYYTQALQGLQQSLAGAMERSTNSPELRDAWQNLNQRYAIFSRVEDAMARAGNEKLNTGFISPRQIASVVSGRDPTRWVEGRDDFTNLVRAGAAIIPDPVPNSGTAQRSFYQDLLTGGKRGAPAAAAAGTAQGLGVAALEPITALGLPYLASRAWYGQPYSREVTGLLGAQAIQGSKEDEMNQ
jgi:hypothetical protein